MSNIIAALAIFSVGLFISNETSACGLHLRKLSVLLNHSNPSGDIVSVNTSSFVYTPKGFEARFANLEEHDTGSIAGRLLVHPKDLNKAVKIILRLSIANEMKLEISLEEIRTGEGTFYKVRYFSEGHRANSLLWNFHFERVFGFWSEQRFGNHYVSSPPFWMDVAASRIDRGFDNLADAVGGLVLKLLPR